MDITAGYDAERLKVLHNIDSELDSNDIAALKFLCRDVVPQKHLERICDGRDLFMRLEDQGLLENGLLIVGELMHTIQRRDLLRFLGSNCTEMEQSLSNPCNCKISLYRKMLYNLSEDVTAEKLGTIKFLLKLPRGKLEPNASFLDVLVAMERQGLLREDSLEELERVLAHCDKQLATRLQEFAGQRAGTPVDTQLSVDTGREYSCDECYDMRRRPRGHCVIINNYSFEEATRKHPELRLGNRDGTDADAMALEVVFSSLQFTVHHHRDLSQAELLEVVEGFGSQKHGQLDAFVCCVLSHGKKGCVYGTDGGTISIRQLTQPFTSSRCPSLAGKPKLFFIQACQVQEEEEEPCLQAHRPGDPWDADAGPVQADTIPNDSDFLLGMATVEHHKSYRHTYRGSAFIQELCEQLKWGCPRKDDILTIMTRVNRKVSTPRFGQFKQMPEPRYTLTKKLILPMS